jgi:uncharacterized protein
MKMIINEFFEIQNRLASLTPMEFRRSLKLPTDKRLVALTGARGTGKTTMLLQYYKEHFDSAAKCLYISVDNPLLSRSSIYDIGSEYFKFYGNVLMLDEVHKQKNWSIDIKALYDSFPDKQLIISGSSRLGIVNQKGDLSRRVINYDLKGLSFREFLAFTYGYRLKAYSLLEILQNHYELGMQISKDIPDILRYFMEYLHYGYYPFYRSDAQIEYQQILLSVIDKVIYEDIPGIKDIKSSSSLVFKKLIAYLAMSKIPILVVSNICNELDITKETLYEYLDILDRAEIINIIRERRASVRSIKRARVLFLNPNLYYAISSELWKHSTELGNIREAFFVSQVDHVLYSSLATDYELEIDNRIIYIEIGGKNKARSQVKNIENGYIFKDGIISGYENVIPLWLAGFLY